MTVGAFVYFEMEIVAEVGFAGLSFEENVAWFIAFMAFVTLTCDSKRIITVVATAAGFAFLHRCHRCFQRVGLVREGLGMAVRAFEHANMHLVAEGYISYPLHLVGYFTRVHALMAVTAVTGDSKGHLVVMTGAAGLPFFHLRHGNHAFFTGDNFTVMAVAAGEAGL